MHGGFSCILRSRCEGAPEPLTLPARCSHPTHGQIEGRSGRPPRPAHLVYPLLRLRQPALTGIPLSHRGTDLGFSTRISTPGAPSPNANQRVEARSLLFLFRPFLLFDPLLFLAEIPSPLLNVRNDLLIETG